MLRSTHQAGFWHQLVVQGDEPEMFPARKLQEGCLPSPEGFCHTGTQGIFLASMWGNLLASAGKINTLKSLHKRLLKSGR